MASPNDLINMIMNKKNNSKAVEDKEENELNLEDRLYLITKQMDNNLKTQIYKNLIDNQNLLVDNNKSLVNDYVYNDVEFLQDHYSNSENGLFNKLNFCQTKMGTLLFEKILMKPIHDIKILKKRQEYLLKVDNQFEELKNLFSKIKDIENELVWFWDDVSLKHIDMMDDMIYFNWNFLPIVNINDQLNNSSEALLVSNIYKIVLAPVLTCITPIITLITPLILMLWFNKKMDSNISYKTIIFNYFKTLWSNDTMKVLIQNPTKAALASLLTKGLYLFMYFQNIYYSIQSSSNTNKLINIIHEKMNKMTQYIDISKKIEICCRACGLENVNEFLGYNDLSKDNHYYKENYFYHDVFLQEPSLFTNKGIILKLFKQFRSYKMKIIDIFQYNGIIDVLLSVQSLLRNSNENYPFVLSKYKESQTPILNIKDIWHPYLVNDKVVKNSIKMKNNLLITGPNAAGKSTFIKSVIINILLSQTIGVNSCSYFEISPFHLIETYLHIPDVKGKSSLFEAEMFRSKEYIEKIKELNENEFSFIVLDEIFSSTNYIEGFSGAYSILKNLSSYQNTLFIVTTHFTDLEILEKDTKGKIENYRFTVDYDENNEIQFNYLLEKGVSNQYIALELLKKNGFDEKILEDAFQISKRISKSKIKKIKKFKKIKNKKKE
jgi:DNA mismatch repair protein MutS